jgi:hypothetical protein
MGRPTYWTKWRVQRTLSIMLEELRAEDNPKTWTLTFKELLVRHRLHSTIFRDWGEKYGEDEDISQSVLEMKEILESRLVSSALRKTVDPFVAQFILKNNYGYADDPKQSARDDERLAMEMQHHSKRLSDARKRAMLDGPKEQLS